MKKKKKVWTIEDNHKRALQDQAKRAGPCFHGTSLRTFFSFFRFQGFFPLNPNQQRSMKLFKWVMLGLAAAGPEPDENFQEMCARNPGDSRCSSQMRAANVNPTLIRVIPVEEPEISSEGTSEIFKDFLTKSSETYIFV